jgi:iron complex outermembrane receptor protein
MWLLGTASMIASLAVERAAAQTAVLEEIVVTAQKREEILKDVPGSLTALGNAQLDRLDIQDMRDLAAYVPGLALNSTHPGQGQVVLRGITSGSLQQNPTVGTYVDDVPTSSSSVFAIGARLAPDIDPFDIQRVEVLRGPQGTLYGASTMGGLLKYVTAAPDPNGWSARIRVGLGTTENGGLNHELKAMANAPLSDRAAVRANVYEKRQAGYIDDVAGGKGINGDRIIGGRLALQFDPTETFRLRITSIGQDTRVNSAPTMDVDPVTLRPVYGDLTQRHAALEKFTQQYQLHNVTANWDLGWASLLSSSSFGVTRSHQTIEVNPLYGPVVARLGGLVGANAPANFTVALPIKEETVKATQEVRLSSPSNKSFEWQLGAFYTYEWSKDHESLTGVAPGSLISPLLQESLHVDIPTRFREYALFGNIDYYLTDRIDVGLGVRWSRNRQAFRQLQNGLLVDPFNPAAIDDTGRGSADSSRTYRITPRYRVTDEMTVYAAIASGYRAGGPNFVPTAGLSSASVPATFGPDTLWNYEVGVKTLFWDKRASLNLSAYYIDWSDIQLTVRTNGASFFGNAGSATSRGFELEGNVTPIDGLLLGFNAAYTQATLSVDALGIGGRAGDSLPNVPKWSAAATIDYSFPLADMKAGIGGSYRYIATRNSGFAADPAVANIRMPSYDLIDLRASVERDRWQAQLFVRNLFDERGIVAATTAYAPPGFPANASITMPRTVGVQLTYSF